MTEVNIYNKHLTKRKSGHIIWSIYKRVWVLRNHQASTNGLRCFFSHYLTQFLSNWHTLLDVWHPTVIIIILKSNKQYLRSLSHEYVFPAKPQNLQITTTDEQTSNIESNWKAKCSRWYKIQRGLCSGKSQTLKGILENF